MTENKPIMIDGVDVSGCKYFKTNYKEDCDVKSDNCCCDTYVPCCSEFKYNCYFKQLARKTQECEELKQYKSLFEKTRNLWNESRMNNYKLLNEIKDLKDSLKRTICQSECYKHKEADKLKQILIEIKEFIQSDYCTEIASCEFCAEAGNCLNRKILQKISECEVK